jgi:hypothetical protein
MLNYVWSRNDDTPFTYALNFTNTTVESRFSLDSNEGTLSFSLSGARVDPLCEANDTSGCPPGISLNASDPTRPQFTFANGSEIIWSQGGSGRWYAVSEAGNLFHDAHIFGHTPWKFLWMVVVVGALIWF